MPANQVAIEYLNMDSKDVTNGLMGEAFASNRMADVKLRALGKLDVEHTEETPLRSWLKHLSEQNGLEYTLPAHVDIVDAIQSTPGAYRFMFWLA